MKNAARKIRYQRPESGTGTVEVHFDETGFQYAEYNANVDNTLRIYNDATMNDRVTVFVLSDDAQSPSTTMLETSDKIEVSGGTYEDVVIKGAGTFQLSLDPAPQTPYQPTGGRRVVIIVPS